MLIFHVPLVVSGQSNHIKIDSLYIDSLAKILIETGSLESYGLLSVQEADMLWVQKDKLLKAPKEEKVRKLQSQVDYLEKERCITRDSIIVEITNSNDRNHKLALAKMLLQIGDSTSLQYLFSHIEKVYNSGAWHSNFFGQYPIAQMLYNSAENNMQYYAHILNEIKTKDFDKIHEPPLIYFYTEFLKRVFANREDLLYIYLHLLLQENKSNEILKSNILSIKNTLNH
jgi:hypothetical protein